MKWHKFRELAEKYPWIVDVVDPLGYLRHNVETSSVDEDKLSMLRPFVRHQLEYIAPRPFRGLDLHVTRGTWESTQTFEYAVRCDPAHGGSRDATYHEEWEIVWHVGDRPAKTSPHDDGYSLDDTTTRIQMGHAEGNFGEGDLVFDFIVKRVLESKGHGMQETMSIEVFEFIPPMRTEKLDARKWVSQQDIEDNRAYVRREPLSPIMPGAIV